MSQGRRIQVRGTVQGVGFRPWVYRLAGELGVTGTVRNEAAGVTIEAFGEHGSLERFVERLRRDAPPAADVAAVEWCPLAPRDVAAFTIVDSLGEGARRPSIPPDLATCPDCLAEVEDPADRRFGYAFTNCTSCGPRYTIALDLPYDRARTTMAGFQMCPDCAAEYADVADRRFHAQPNACPACGPHLTLQREGVPTALTGPDALPTAARLLVEGEILAVKGLGGYHLACDATSAAAVDALRQRKRRDHKPFAVMAPDLEAARRLAVLSEAEEAPLTSVERPIVLARRAEGAPLAPSIAPDSEWVGLMLPYTPLHHLLLRAVGRPLVMTSGNVAGEPIAYDDADARSRLGPIADATLTHDRPIAHPAEDSVVRVAAGAPIVIRRSRGFVPRPIRLARPLSQVVLAVGADLKNSFCLVAGDEAWPGPHIGDLDDLTASERLAETIAHFEDMLQLRPEVIAHDLHPDMQSTRYARQRAVAEGLSAIAVQHHHAHLAAVAAEHGLTGPVIGAALDGVGYGDDGEAWGGEILLLDGGRAERIATLRPIPLAGGDLATREVWRLALAVLDDAFDGSPPAAALSRLASEHAPLVRRMIAHGVNSPLAHGAGRWFDALASLALGRTTARYEGELAAALEQAADGHPGGPYPYGLDRRGAPWEIDLRPMVRAAVEDLAAPGRVAARFHDTLAAAVAEVIILARIQHGPLPVVLGGGCFVNGRLLAGVREGLGPAVAARSSRALPPGDGGLALGQAMVADTRLREGA